MGSVPLVWAQPPVARARRHAQHALSSTGAVWDGLGAARVSLPARLAARPGRAMCPLACCPQQPSDRATQRPAEQLLLELPAFPRRAPGSLSLSLP